MLLFIFLFALVVQYFPACVFFLFSLFNFFFFQWNEVTIAWFFITEKRRKDDRYRNIDRKEKNNSTLLFDQRMMENRSHRRCCFVNLVFVGFPFTCVCLCVWVCDVMCLCVDVRVIERCLMSTIFIFLFYLFIYFFI